MITIDDIEIKMKKYDRDKNVVTANLVIFGQLEIRGFTLRYTTTKHSLIRPVWLVTPPSKKFKEGIWFWIVRFKDAGLWQQIQKLFIEEAERWTKTV